MKKLLLLLLIGGLSYASMGQGKSNGKGKEKYKHSSVGYKSGKSGHQPKKVHAAFYSDYPGASNVVWRKYKGDYTATFNNGVWRSTAVYHANGERRDTRTVLTRRELPGTIWDRIFRRDRITPTQYIMIERPSTAEKIYRVLTSRNTTYYYDENGYLVNYNY